MTPADALLWFDTHAHLSDPQFDADRDDTIARAAAAGVGTIVEIADGPSEWQKARVLAERHPEQLWWAAGLHPYHADQASPALWDALAGLAGHPQFVAIGEVGLDYAKCPIPRDVQASAFRSALALAVRIQKPLIIHCRDAYADLRPILRESFPSNGVSCPGVVHCFSGNADDAAELVSMGFYLGVDAPITYPSAAPLRAALATVPIERLVLETDSPYLPPQTHRGKRNEPFHLPAVGARLGELKGEPLTAVGNATRRNAHRLFHLNPSE